jgi:hypothetical protein
MTATTTCNVTSTITAQFEKTGNKSARVVVGGNGNAKIKLRLSWDDDPDDAGDAIDTISVFGTTWNSPNESGQETNTVNNITPGNYNISFSGLINGFKSVSNSSIKMVDNDGNDTNAEFEIISVTQNTFNETVTATMTVPENVTGTNCVATSWSGSGPSGTTYSKTGPGTNSTLQSGTATICGGNSDPCGVLGSPKVRTWTMTTTSPNGCVASESSSVNIRNDDCPSDSWTTSHINLDPGITKDLTLGTISCADAPVTVTAVGDSNFVGSGSSFSTSKDFNNGDTVVLRTNTLPFNTDLSGLAADAEFGKTNSKTVSVDFGCYSKSITVTTKAPKIKEDFNYADNINKYPYEDIDLISNSPTQHLASGSETMGEIDIAVEIKVDKPDAQVRVNGGSWQNVRSI